MEAVGGAVVGAVGRPWRRWAVGQGRTPRGDHQGRTHAQGDTLTDDGKYVDDKAKQAFTLLSDDHLGRGVSWDQDGIRPVGGIWYQDVIPTTIRS